MTDSSDTPLRAGVAPMAGVAQTNVIDLVAQDATGRFMLVMIESREWGETAEMASQLREKLNTYANFILDGGLERHYPETRGKPVDIQLTCSSSPTEPYVEIIDHAAAQLERLGIGFRISVRPIPAG